MKKNIFTRLLSAVILLSVLVSLLTVFPSADNTGAENEQKNSDALNVIYNRDFDEGWNYTNGLSAKYAAENIFGIEYTKVTASKYNHYLSVVSMGEKSGYLSLDAQKHTPTSGKRYSSRYGCNRSYRRRGCIRRAQLPCFLGGGRPLPSRRVRCSP